MFRTKYSLASRFFGLVKPHLPFVMVIFLTGLLQAGVSLIAPWITKIMIDHILIGKEGTWTLGKIISLLTLTMCMGIVLQFARNWMETKLFIQLTNELRLKLYAHILKLSPRFFDSRQAGSIISRVIQDVNGAQNLVSAGVLGLLIDLLFVIFAGCMVVLLHWKLALFCLILLPLYAISHKKFNSKLRRSWKEVHQESENMSGDLVERVSGVRVVQSFQREQFELERLRNQSQTYTSKLRYTYLLSNVFGRITQSLTEIGKIIIWIAGASFVLNGDLSVGGLIAFQAYLALAYGPINRFAATNVMIQNSFSNLERIFEVLDIEPEIKNADHAIPLDQCRGEVRFEHVGFFYKEERGEQEFALQNINFTAYPGQMVALVGPSGAGKSTLIQLISRFYDPEAGTVRLDGIDLKEYELHSLRNQVAAVFQDHILFSGTIYENISYGNPEATRDEVIEAAKAANVHTFVMEWEDQYSTIIGERGTRLSGGQKQRIAIARAFLKNPRILILDEATSALDAESEALVTEALDKLMQGRTTFVIAHRLSTIVRAEQILVMNQGEIVEQGTHHTLWGNRGLYWELYEKQWKAMRPQEQIESGQL
ncbi:ABC transporter ATP-binding protein [Paenibacillus sp. Soil787]|uniref:ABC transporter ATP-binding protein n=1 Tax=Paenibacillus sp. Soil787 TaxID=1736411 RepID=UPI0006F71B64|nr:ABC transporter ATP-binding protein [Paenibacillus sp. Soil787]KRF35890.1 ABC transporter permease [Paenibacillus sp. Soil787]